MNNKILKEKEAYYLAEIKSINEHIERLENILKLDLSKFDNKVLNIRFSKAIGETVQGNYIMLYAKNCTGHYGIKKNGHQSIIYSTYNRAIQVDIITDNNRIMINETLNNIKLKINNLEIQKKDYQLKFDNYDNNIKNLDNIVSEIKKLTDGLDYEDKEYILKNHYIKL